MPSPEWFQSLQVIQKFRLHSKPKFELQPVLEMRGRPAGFLNMILSMLGLNVVTVLLVTTTEVYRHSRSFSGDIIDYIPLRALEAVSAGAARAFQLLILAFLMLVFAGVGGYYLGVGAAVGGVAGFFFFVIWFSLSKRYQLIFSAGSNTISMRFKSAIVSSGSVNLQALLDAVDVVRELLTDADQPGGSRVHTGSSSRRYDDADESPRDRKSRSQSRDDDDRW